MTSLDDDEVTLQREAFVPPAPDEPVRPSEGAAREPEATSRYEFKKVLGVGGMGEVQLCRDQRIGRSIAMKIIDERRARSAEVRGRFLSEARIQGQLQHPSIVPVYELDKNERGIDYFTMKRVAGATLERIVDGLADGNRTMRARFPQERLLGVFRRLCQCLEYVHAAGVVHRDIKPGNIMAGDFGEVFLLDWGLAKLVEDSEVEDTSGRTRRGQILGTPGYMSPEQAVDAQSIDERTDVYSLGCILFEMLTHEPFLKGKNARELMRATQLGSMERASERAPQLDIPPELDDVCLKATQRDPDDRYTSVQQMREAIDRYLEGERDVGLRQRLAQRHLERADSIAGRADGSHEARHHAQAVREAGRALALDPENAQAQQLLMKLMLSAPDDIAESDQRRVHREAALLTEAKLAGGLAALAYGTFLVLLLAVAAFQGVRSTTGFLAVVIPLTVGVATATWRRRSDAPGSNLGVATHLAGTVAVAAAAGVAGAMILVPVLATANTLAFGTSVNLRPRRKLILGAGCLALLLPTVLEWTGWLPRIYSFENGQIVVTPTTLDLSPVVTPVALFLVSAAAIAVPLIAVWRISNELEDKRRQLHQRLWHLTQLLPQLQTVDRLTNPPFEAMAPARGPLSPR